MSVGIAGKTGVVLTSEALREIYASQHVGAQYLTTKYAQTLFAQYTVTPQDARDWAQKKKLLRDEFMFGVNMSNVDNMLNFICTWNGVKVVDSVYARPGITGAPTFGAGQNKVLEFTNDMRIEGLTGLVASPRNHAKWRSVFNGTIDFGSLEEYSYGQNPVDISNGIDVQWFYYFQGTGNITVYYDHLRVTL